MGVGTIILIIMLILNIILIIKLRTADTPNDEPKKHIQKLKVALSSELFLKDLQEYKKAGYELSGDFTLEDGVYKATLIKTLDDKTKIDDVLKSYNLKP